MNVDITAIMTAIDKRQAWSNLELKAMLLDLLTKGTHESVIDERKFIRS